MRQQTDLLGVRLHPKAAEYRYTGHWWYGGTEQQWRALPRETQEQLALEQTGCLYAFPSWKECRTCVHTDCRIARGEIRPIVKVNAQLKGERESGWLRFISDRDRLAKIFKAHRAIARRTGVYDIWSKDAWALTICSGIGA